MAQAAIYLALAPKSNAAEAGIDAALAEVRHGPARKVPDYLRDRHRPGSENYGTYKYPHDYPEGWVEQRYLPDGLERGCFYRPSERGWEAYRADAAARDRAAVLDRTAESRAAAGDLARGSKRNATAASAERKPSSEDKALSDASAQTAHPADAPAPAGEVGTI